MPESQVRRNDRHGRLGTGYVRRHNKLRSWGHRSIERAMRHQLSVERDVSKLSERRPRWLDEASFNGAVTTAQLDPAQSSAATCRQTCQLGKKAIGHRSLRRKGDDEACQPTVQASLDHREPEPLAQRHEVGSSEVEDRTGQIHDGMIVKQAITGHVSELTSHGVLAYAGTSNKHDDVWRHVPSHCGIAACVVLAIARSVPQDEGVKQGCPDRQTFASRRVA